MDSVRLLFGSGGSSQAIASLVEYRNRLHLERFFRALEREHSNLLDAALALQVGFGSYAQFHSVHCRLLGASPRQYSRERNQGIQAAEDSGRAHPQELEEALP
jgi:AraC-like DNA-binding protein